MLSQDLCFILLMRTFESSVSRLIDVLFFRIGNVVITTAAADRSFAQYLGAKECALIAQGLAPASLLPTSSSLPEAECPFTKAPGISRPDPTGEDSAVLQIRRASGT